MSEDNQGSELSKDTKVIIIVGLLIFAFPVGLILMWVWNNVFPMWLNILITCLVLIPIILLIFTIFSFLLISPTVPQN